jgi:hypothetical protein
VEIGYGAPTPVPVPIGYGVSTAVPVARMSEPLYAVKMPEGTPLAGKTPVGAGEMPVWSGGSARAVKMPEGRSRRAGRRATAGVVCM